MWTKITICLVVLFAVAAAQENNYKPGEMLVFLKSGIVTLAPGEQKGEIETIQGSEALMNYLNSLGFQELRRVVPDFSPDDTIAITDDGITVKIPDYSRLFKIIVSVGIDIQVACDSLNSFLEVINAEPNYILQVEATPNDLKFPQQWNLDQTSDYDIDMKQGWDVEKGNYEIKIGILDMGVQYQHEDFGNGFGSGYKVKGGWDYIDNDPYPDGHYGSDDFPHGNHVAGIAGALTHNNKGVAGIAGGWGGSDLGCALYAYEIGGTYGVYLDYAISAILRASKPTYQGGDGVQILNNSWGGYEWIEEERKAVITAYKYGRTFVAAKGNDNTSFHHLPSDYDRHCVFSVGATDNFDNRWYDPSTGNGSNYGNGIDVVAPGWEIWSTARKPSDYCDTSGTSMSAPHVSGLAGLIWSRAYEKGISLQPEDIEGIIKATAFDPPWSDPGYDDYYGAGRINAYDALRYFDYPQSIRRYTVTPTSGITVGFYTRQLVGIPGLPDGTYFIMVNEYRSDFVLPSDTIKFLGVWGLGRLTTGYSNAGPNYGEGYCAVEKLPNGQYRAKTYVYFVMEPDPPHQTIGWFPRDPYQNNILLRYSIFSVNVVAPFNLHATNVTENSLILDWDYNYLELIDGFTVKKDGLVIGNPGSGQTQWTVTGLEPGHMYHFEVLARKGGVYSAPAVLDAGTIPTGAFAQSSCAMMSAFNSNCKVVRSADGKIHAVYYDGIDVYYSYSTDGGATFEPWQFIDHGDTIPALAIDANGTLWLVNAKHDYPNQNTRRLEYYLYKKSAGGWSISYDEIYQITFPVGGSNDNAVLHPPSFTIVGNTGYIAFQEPGVEEYNVYVSEFPLSLNTSYTATFITEYGYYPSIGYDNGGRIVTLVYEYDLGYGYGPLRLYYRALGNNTWSSQEVLPYSDYDGAFGAPSLSVGINELTFTAEGTGNNGQISGLLYRRLTWPAGGNSYALGPIELVSPNADFSPNNTEGYNYLTLNDVALWRYQDDIWYSRRMGSVWTPKTNISATTGNLSSYPQGIVYGSMTTAKLFALWTEQVGNQYYLVRKVINLPYAYPVYAVGNSDIPEATAYNNAQRFLKDANGISHLAFTSGGNVYHTFLQDTIWSEPVLIGEGKYPTLSLAPDGKLYCVWSFNGLKKIGGPMYYVEYLYLSSFNAIVR